MAPTMVDVPMDAQALRELLPTPTFEPEMINIPIDADALQGACTGVATTIIKEVRVESEGVSGWWLVLTVVIALFTIGGVVIVTEKGRLRLLRELRGLPPHKLHEKLEEWYYQMLKEDGSSQLKDYVANQYKGAIYEDDLEKQERTIKVVQDLSSGDTKIFDQDEMQSQSQSTSAVEDEETAELNETIGLIKGSSSSSSSGSGSVSDSDSWSDLSPEEREEKEKRPPSPWKSTNQEWQEKQC